MAERFREGEIGLQRAIDKGAVEAWTDEDTGVEFCSYRSISSGTERGVNLQLSVKKDSLALSVCLYAVSVSIFLFLCSL